MRASTKDQLKKLQNILLDNSYIKTSEICQKTKLCPGSVYRMIRMLREEKKIGIIPTKQGYVLAAFATQKDDVGFLRKLNGRRTSDWLALDAAKKHIGMRWNKVEERAQLLEITSPLTSNLPQLQYGLKLLSNI